MGRGSASQPDLHRRAQGSTRIEAVIEAEVLEKSLNGGLTFGEAEAAQIQNARERRDPLVTANLKQGAYLVAVQTLHGASQMPGFEVWGNRTAAKKNVPAKKSAARSR